MADDNIANSATSQNQPIFETVPVEEVSTDSYEKPVNFVPEEIPEETPEDLTISDIDNGGGFGGGNIPPLDESAFDEGSGIKKYVLLALGVVGVIILFIVIFTVILGLLRGGKDEKVSLEYWGLWEDESVMKTVIEDYKRVKPNVTIKYVARDHADYRIKLVTRAREGGGPDIFRFHNTWLPSIIDIAASLPSTVMTAEEYEKTFYPVIQNDMKSNGSYYGISLGIDGLVLVYNDGLFKSAGITSYPKTWDDLVQDANKLRVIDPQSGEIVTSGVALGSAKNIEHFSDILGWMLLQNGAHLRNLAAPEAIEVLANFRQFSEPQLNFWNSNMPKDVNAFVEGKVAMIIVPSWHVLNIKKSNPELELKVAPLPVLPGIEPVAIATYWAEGVSKSSKHQTEAWGFLRFLSSKEEMTKLYQEQTKVRLFGVPYSRVDLRDTLIQNEYAGAVLEQAPYMQSMPVSARTFDQGLNDEIIGYLRNAVNSTEGGVSYKEAFTLAGAGVTEVFQKYNIQ